MDDAAHQALSSAKPASWHGALTAVVSTGPDYMGASGRGISIQPGFFLRHGRWSISSNGSFAARHDDDEHPRGFGLELFSGEHAWVRLSMRVDSGRRSKGISALTGIDDVPRTVRLRLAARSDFSPGWAITPGLNLDLLGKGVGHTADLQLSRDWKLSSRLNWSVTSGLTWGSRRYIQSYFGVNASESRASGYALYSPGAGVRDVWLGTGFRYDINHRWVLTGNTSLQHLMGDAASSPLTHQRTSWGASVGLGWRF